MERPVENYDVVVIGGGAAGLTAAIYTGRARLKTLVLEKALPGGLATYTSEVENYPGFPEPIAGPDLMKLFEKQAKRFGAKMKLSEVTEVDLKKDPKLIRTPRVDYLAKVVVVATGGRPRLTGAKNEEKFLFDKGISFCATCDAARFSGKEVLVVGSGDAAIEEALFIAKFASKVKISVVHDPGIMDANKVAQEKALAEPKLEFIWNTMVEAFDGEEELEAVILRHMKNGQSIRVPVQGCFLFIGYVPNTEIFAGQLAMTKNGYIITNDLMETSIPGVFAVGDVRDKYLRQVATCVGDGAIAGVRAEKFLAEMEFIENNILQPRAAGFVFCWDPTQVLCREMMAQVEALERKYGGRVKFSRVDVYKWQTLAQRLGVSEAPAFVLLKEGRVAEVLRGQVSFAELEKRLQEMLPETA